MIRRRLVPLLSILVVPWAGIAVLGACSSEGGLQNKPGAVGSSQTSEPVACEDKDGDGRGVGCPAGNDCDDSDPKVGGECYACATPSPGCSCPHDGARTACGKVESKVGDQLTCGYGQMQCDKGKWGPCVLDNALEPQSLGSATKCPFNPCDPTCQQFPDKPDPSMTNDAGIIGSDGGLTLGVSEGGAPWNTAPNGPMPKSVEDTLKDAGAYPDGSFYYHEIAPGDSTAPEPFDVTAATKFVDVYFLLDTSATMGEALVALGNAMGGSTGVVQQVKSKFPNARFGVGHFHGYQTAPHDVNPNSNGGEVRPLWHTLNMQTDEVAAQHVMTWLGNSGTTGNDNATEGFAVALFAEASATGLYRGPGLYWVDPRNAGGAQAWTSDYGGAAPPAAAVGTGPCPDPAVQGQTGQGTAFPCFAPGAKPITIVMTDNPGENGPGGQFSLGHGSTEATYTNSGGIPGTTKWETATNVDSTGNGVEASAVPIDPTTWHRYRGTFTANGAPAGGRLRADADSDGTTYTVKGFDTTTTHFPTMSQGDCSTTDGQGGREAFFKFTLSSRSFVHFDTWGSSADTVLYIVDSARTRVACRDDVGWISNSAMDTLDTSMKRQANLNARLAAGSYTLVVDQVNSGCPSGYSLGTNGHCYKYSGSTTATWNAASTACTGTTGANLASIETAAEDLVVTTLFSGVSSQKIFIGAKKNGASYQWVDGTAWSWTNWASGQPAANTCVRRKSDGKWETTDCGSTTERYLCEYVPGANEYFLQVNAKPDANPVAAPSWDQTIAAHNAIGGKIIGIDVSGMGPLNSTGTAFDTCDAPNNEVNHAWDRWTYAHLQEAARATGSVDATNANAWTNPFVFSMNNKGGPCHAGDPTIGSQVISAITKLSATIREDVTVRAYDADNANDFDYAGAPGSVPQLTPLDLDEGPQSGYTYGVFIKSVTALPTFTNGLNGSGDPAPGGLGLRCNDNPATADVIEQCLPDTVVKFQVAFTVPAVVVARPQAQIFGFDVQALGSGTGVLGSKPAVIVVPPLAAAEYTDGWFTRDFDVSGLCPSATAVAWGHWSWTATTPSDSKVDFTVATAKSAAALASAPATPLQFTNPPGPGILTGMPVVAKAGVPDTQLGAAVVDTTLALKNMPRNDSFLRVKAHLAPSSNKLSAPTLQGWNLEFSCPDSE